MMMKLHIIPTSHAAMSARLMLDYKEFEYKTVERLSGLHPILLRMAGFDRWTALRSITGSSAVNAA